MASKNTPHRENCHQKIDFQHENRIGGILPSGSNTSETDLQQLNRLLTFDYKDVIRKRDTMAEKHPSASTVRCSWWHAKDAAVRRANRYLAGRQRLCCCNTHRPVAPCLLRQLGERPVPRIKTGWKKYRNYDLKVDKDQNDMAKEIKLTSAGKPHMRAFHGTRYEHLLAIFNMHQTTCFLNIYTTFVTLQRRGGDSSLLSSSGSPSCLCSLTSRET